MIKILNPHHSTTTTLKTAEILSKYRPIAPKPWTPHIVNDEDHDSFSSSMSSHKISQSPYLCNLWTHLQARPTRTRKRGRGGMGGPTSHLTMKRHKPCGSTTTTSSTQHVFGPVKTLSFQGLPHVLPNLTQVGSSGLVTPPLLQCSTLSSKCMELETKPKCVLDLKQNVEVPQEIDFLKQLQKPISTSTSKVIALQVIRPVCSRINVTCINQLTNQSKPSKKSQEEVEEEVECEDLPAIVSDSKNRVRLVNSAYKEMMGQPECPWLDSMVRGKRICGEVMINLCESKVLKSNNGFSCWVRIEWGREEFVPAFCDVKTLACDSKDYVLAWRFHTNKTCH